MPLIIILGILALAVSVIWGRTRARTRRVQRLGVELAKSSAELARLEMVLKKIEAARRGENNK